MEKPMPIAELLVVAESPDIGTAARALREILARNKECVEHIPWVIDLLRNPNAARADFAFQILARMGEIAIPALVAAFQGSEGTFRRLIMGLLTGAPFDVYFPLLKREIEHGELEDRYWAANCFGRQFSASANWNSEAMRTLDEAIELLLSLRDTIHWPQARITLKHIGTIPPDADVHWRPS